MSAGDGVTVETALNFQVAEHLRRFGLDAEAEQRNVVDPERRQHQVDVLVELEDECVAIEAEFAPARDVEKDALKRLPTNRRLLWRGRPITRAFTLVYPNDYRNLAVSVSTRQLEACETLRFKEITRQRKIIRFGGEQIGTVRDLSDLLLNYWTQARRPAAVDQVVATASEAIAASAVILKADPYIQQPHDDSDPAATCALVWLNALLFQELLAANLSPSSMPVAHQGKSIPVPSKEASVTETLAEWTYILSINWYPIFDLAKTALSRVSTARAHQVLSILRECASGMAQDQVIKQHDIAGRVFHRLLNSRKYLATNYTTIPAAVMLAGLAFGSPNGPLASRSTRDTEALADGLRIVDPACGSGTLLMAALQEVLKACRSSTSGSQAPDMKPILERSLYGYDVVPGAEHLTNTTLSMAETSRVLSGIHIYTVPHDVEPTTKVPRLGSLDFLRRAPNHESVVAMEMFPSGSTATRSQMSGEKRKDIHLPAKVDLFISNPPYTRAGGPGSTENTMWNPLFGSVLSDDDATKMKIAITKTLTGTIGSMYAGLGSAFVALMDQEIREGGMLAVVLPLTAVTGSRWQPVRDRLLEGYQIEWVITSHDPRHRTKTKDLPGRRWCSFSESTRIAETLIVATRTTDRTNHRVNFVNLRHNPDDPADAIALTRALLNHTDDRPITGRTDMRCADIDYPHPSDKWGEIVSVKQSQLGPQAWMQVAFTDCALTEAAALLRAQHKLGTTTVPIAELGTLAELGPYHMQIKGKGGLFDCSEDTPTRLQDAGLWHHRHDRVTTMNPSPDAVLKRRQGLKNEQDQMLQRAGRLHLAAELGHAPQRIAAAVTDRSAIGISSWITLNLLDNRPGTEEALCLWLNSTPGMLLRITHANRPYLGRSRVPHELARSMPVLDMNQLNDKQIAAASDLFADLKDSTLQGFAKINDDPARHELNHRFAREILGCGESDVQHIDDLTHTLANEPTMTTRH